MRLKTRHLLGIHHLSPDEISLILDTAESFAEIGTREIKKVPTLRGKTVVNFFVEPSTRTRSSFELAETHDRLGAGLLEGIEATAVENDNDVVIQSLLREHRQGFLSPQSGRDFRCGIRLSLIACASNNAVPDCHALIPSEA